MEEAVQSLFEWAQADDPAAYSFRVYTPNVYTEHYDYLIHWIANKNNSAVPSSVRTSDDEFVYVLAEPENEFFNERYVPWLTESVEGGVRTRQQKIGSINIETWRLEGENIE